MTALGVTAGLLLTLVLAVREIGRVSEAAVVPGLHHVRTGQHRAPRRWVLSRVAGSTLAVVAASILLTRLFGLLT